VLLDIRDTRNFDIAPGSPRSKRARHAGLATLPEATPPTPPPPQTTAAAIHLLDTQFPWLRGAEG
jgi:hypothetical protein